MQSHTIHKECGHFGWDNSLDPVLSAKPGETVEIETVDASGGQLNPKSDLASLIDLDFAKINPVTGPIFVEGAEPGDAIAISFLEFGQADWGWTALIPGFGLLADEFPDPTLLIWSIDTHSTNPALFGDCGKIPLNPSWRFWTKSTCQKEFFRPPQPLNLGSERLNYSPWRSRSACSARKFRFPPRPP